MDFVSELCAFVLKNAELTAEQIGVITFYKAQVQELRNAFAANTYVDCFVFHVLL